MRASKTYKLFQRWNHCQTYVKDNNVLFINKFFKYFDHILASSSSLFFLILFHLHKGNITSIAV